MSSSRSERAGRVLLRAATAALIALLPAAPEAFAGYAVRVEYLDPNGATVQVEGEDASYRSYRRTIYRQPRGPDGRTYEDDEIVRQAFPFRSRKVGFSTLREVRFERRSEEGREILVLSFETTTGRRFEMLASDLEGAAHPISPLVDFRTAEGTVRIPIDPVTPAVRREGRPSLVKIEFPGNPDRRRPQRPPRKARPESP